MSNPEYSTPYWQESAGARGASRAHRRAAGGPGRAPRLPASPAGDGAADAASRRSRRGNGPADRGPQTASELRQRLGLSPEAGYGGGWAGNARFEAAWAASTQARTSTVQRDRAGSPRGRSRTTVPAPRRGAPGRGGGPGGPRGARPPKRRGSWWRRWTWKKAVAVIAGMVATVLAIALLGLVYAYSKTQLPAVPAQAVLRQSSTAYFSDGTTPIGTFSFDGASRQLLTSQQIPPDVKNAVIAAEDRHFYTEGGISVTGILRAAKVDLTGGSAAQGGSTITQQLVRNYYPDIGTGRTIKRKFKEILLAVKLSHEKSKDWILTHYLNTVYLGSSAYGVGAAAQVYFNKPASALTTAQAAMLAALINEPGYFDPDPTAGPPYQALVARWRYVLANMVRDGALTHQQASAQTFPKVVNAQPGNGWTGYRGYLMAMVQQELTGTYHLSIPQIDTGGLRIVTTFNLGLTQALNRAVARDERLMRAYGGRLPSYAHVGAVLEQPGTGNILAVYGGPGYGVKHCVRLACDVNRAEEPEQVGSSFKPYVLATAVAQGMDVQSSVLNGYSPLCVPPDWTLADRLTLSTQGTSCPSSWWPFSAPGENSGPLSVPQAAAISSDPAFEDLAHRVGVQNVLAMAGKLGVGHNPFNSNGWNDLKNARHNFGPHGARAGSVTIALGPAGAELTAVEQASTFATLASGGHYVAPHVIASLAQGTTTIQRNVAQGQPLTPSQAGNVDYALSLDTQPGGTGYPAAAWNRPVIAKTGTTNTAQDAWFVGAIPQYSMAVTIFTNSQDSKAGSQSLDILPALSSTQNGGYGGTWPATIWHTFMSSQFQNLPVRQLPPPSSLGFAKWVQVQPVRKHHRHSKGHGRSPSPSPTPSTSCTPSPAALCVSPSPSPGGTPSPAPSGSPNPSRGPNCTPSFQSPCPPASPGTGQAAVTAAVFALPAGEPAHALAGPQRALSRAVLSSTSGR